MRTLKTPDECQKTPGLFIAYCTDRHLLSDFYLKLSSVSRYVLQEMDKKLLKVTIHYSEEKKIKNSISNAKKLLDSYQLRLDNIKKQNNVCDEEYVKYSKDQLVVDIRDVYDMLLLLSNYYIKYIVKNLCDYIDKINYNEKYLFDDYKGIYKK